MSSTIIIRLQNLPLSAKASDIRDFFSGLRIPEGQVNIVGGPQRDAFIGVSSDEDARRVMSFDDRELHGSKIKLLLSSKVEMEQVIANAHGRFFGLVTKNKKGQKGFFETLTRKVSPYGSITTFPMLSIGSSRLRRGIFHPRHKFWKRLINFIINFIIKKNYLNFPQRLFLAMAQAILGRSQKPETPKLPEMPNVYRAEHRIIKEQFKNRGAIFISMAYKFILAPVIFAPKPTANTPFGTLQKYGKIWARKNSIFPYF